MGTVSDVGKNDVSSVDPLVQPMERALQDNSAPGAAERRIREMYDAIAAGVVVQNADGVITQANSAACRILGMSRDELLGRRSSDPVWNVVGDDDLPIPGDQHPAMVALRTSQPVQGFVMCLYKGTEEERWIQVSAEPIIDPTTGKAREVVSTFIDINALMLAERERRESERRMQEVVDSAPFGAHVYDLLPDGRLVFVGANESANRILGVDCRQFIGKTIEEAFPPLTDTQVPQAYREVAATGRLYECEQVEYSEGRIFGAFEIHAFQPAPNRIAVFFRDITERKRMEESRRRFEKRVDGQKRRFYRDTILSVTDGKLMICDASDVKRFTRTAQEVVEVREPQDVSPARQMVSNYCADQGLAPGDLQVFLTGVGEAITNAVKHGGGVGGFVYTGRTRDSVWVAVADQGSGIASLILPRAVLLRGFSTKPSLGLGYSLMLDSADQIMLKTSRRGTTVVLFKRLQPVDLELTSAALPDMWI